MAVYKLENIASYKMGVFESKRTISQLAVKAYPVISAGVTFKGFYPEYNRDGKYICISVTGAAGFVTIYEGKFWASGDCLTLQLKDKENINWNYFKFLIKKTEKAIAKLGKGSVIKHISWKDIKDMKLTIPTINEQQKIIDIIEPIETQTKIIESIKSKILFLAENLEFGSVSLMKKKVIFEKGKILNSENFVEFNKNEKNLIPFINIKSLLGKANKFVDRNKYQANVKIGDVLLSLDGTPGRVSIINHGFNGYAYKIKSDVIPQSILWASLLNNKNQRIIKMFSFGTNILHATKAKRFLKVMHFNNFDLIENIYQVYVLIHKINTLLEKSKKLLIKLLIKN